MIKFIAPEDRIVYGPGETANGTVNLSDKEKEILALLSEDSAYTYKILLIN